MFQDLKPYPEYVDAKLSWLDRFPSHWSMHRFKQVLSPVDNRSSTGEEELLTVSSALGVVPRSSQAVTMFKAASYIGHKLASPGDLVINSLWAWGRGLGVSRHSGIVSTAYGVYRPNSPEMLDADFLHLYVRSEPYNWELHERSRGIWVSRLQLTDDRFLTSPFVAPPIEEQRAIVTYLAHAHQRINKAISNKRRLIALLGEQQRVSRDSLLAEASQQNRRLLGRVIARIEQGWSPTAAEGPLTDDQWAVLSLSAVNQGQFYPRALKPIPADRHVPESLTVRDGDVLITRSNTRNRVGDAAVVRSPRPKTIISDLIYRLTPGPLLDAEYLALFLQSSEGRRQIESDARGSSDTMPKISQSHIKRWRIPVPSLEDQREMVRAMDAESRRIKGLLFVAEREIALLEQFRTRLTADVVTGQVDVRSIAANLPPVDLTEVFDASASADSVADNEMVAEVTLEDQ